MEEERSKRETISQVEGSMGMGLKEEGLKTKKNKRK